MLRLIMRLTTSAYRQTWLTSESADSRVAMLGRPAQVWADAVAVLRASTFAWTQCTCGP